MSLCKYIPDPEVLIKLPPELVGMQLLKVCAEKTQNGLFSLGAVAGNQALFGESWNPNGDPYYPNNRQDEIELAAAEAFRWLEIALLIMPAPEPNKTFSRLTRLGKSLLQNEDSFGSFLSAVKFPKDLFHPSIAEYVWLQLAQGNFDVAVFFAFRAVEERVRDAAGFPSTEIGVNLMRRAFHKENGPLTRLEDPEAEREALSSLFAGAIGSYKNPHSHRTVQIVELAEAQEMILLASHLLRIVDDRKKIK